MKKWIKITIISLAIIPIILFLPKRSYSKNINEYVNKSHVENKIVDETINLLSQKISLLDVGAFRIKNAAFWKKDPWYRVNNNTIYLAINPKKTSNYQKIYQFSHEIIHHIIYQKEGKTKKYDGKFSNAHEKLALAFSYYALDYFFEDNTYLDREIENVGNANDNYSLILPDAKKIWKELENSNDWSQIFTNTIDEWNREREK